MKLHQISKSKSYPCVINVNIEVQKANSTFKNFESTVLEVFQTSQTFYNYGLSVIGSWSLKKATSTKEWLKRPTFDHWSDVSAWWFVMVSNRLVDQSWVPCDRWRRPNLATNEPDSRDSSICVLMNPDEARPDERGLIRNPNQTNFSC